MPSHQPLSGIPSVCEVVHVRGPKAPAGSDPDVLVEVPHGATRASDFTSLRAELRDDYPADLQDFFFVNTDVGAPEVGVALAERLVVRRPASSVAVLRCSIPRTFVDCNRVIDAAAEPRASQAGEVTPGLHVYVRDPEDRRLLLSRYAAYRELATSAFARVCGNGGAALMLHSYAPRSIDVPVDERIVERLRREYQPDRIGTWPLRAEIDLIVRDPEGKVLASPSLLAAVKAEATAAGFGVALGEAYALHPVTLAHGFAVQYPGSTLCLELRRDLLVAEFTPFAEMRADVAKVARIADVLAAALASVLERRRE